MPPVIPYRRLPATIALCGLGVACMAVPGEGRDALVLSVAGLAHGLGFACWALAGAWLLGGSMRERLGVGGQAAPGIAFTLAAVLGCVALSHAVAFGVDALLGSADPPLALRAAARASRLDAVFLLVGIGLAPAVGEELLFRGALQRGLSRSLPPAVAIGLCALAFAAFHPGPERATTAGVLGVYLGVVSRGRGGVPLAMLCHAANNVVVLVTAR